MIGKILSLGFLFFSSFLWATNSNSFEYQGSQEIVGTEIPSKKVDAVLMLAADISGSIHFDEQIMQREGHMEALQSPEVLSAIKQGYYGRIAVSYVEWSGGDSRYVVPWQVIDSKDPKTVKDFVLKISQAPFEPLEFNTTIIHQVIDWARIEMKKSGYETGLPSRYILDIAGDGADVEPFSLLEARGQAKLEGIVVNGLAVNLNPDKIDLTRYYKTCVAIGLGSFVEDVRDWKDFATALRRKLVKEIASTHTYPQYAMAGEMKLEIDDECYPGRFALEDSSDY